MDDRANGFAAGRMTGRRDFLKAIAAGMPAWLMPGVLLGAGGNDSALLAAAGKRPKFALIRRTQWGGRPAPTSAIKTASTFTRLTVHHGGAGVVEYTDKTLVAGHLRAILGWHLKKGFGDIAYHFVIDYAGRIWEARSLLLEGSHVSGENSENIGVMLTGNFEKQHPAARQLLSLGRLSAVLCKNYPIERRHIYGHKDIGASLCPGKNLYYPYISRLRNGIPVLTPEEIESIA